MTRREIDKEKIQNLKDGEYCTVNWFEEGGGSVERDGSVLYLSYVPQYGGEPQFEDYYPVSEESIEKLLDVAYSWT